jgi:hypothetical protein
MFVKATILKRAEDSEPKQLAPKWDSKYFAFPVSELLMFCPKYKTI